MSNPDSNHCICDETMNLVPSCSHIKTSRHSLPLSLWPIHASQVSGVWSVVQGPLPLRGAACSQSDSLPASPHTFPKSRCSSPYRRYSQTARRAKSAQRARARPAFPHPQERKLLRRRSWSCGFSSSASPPRRLPNSARPPRKRRSVRTRSGGERLLTSSMRTRNSVCGSNLTNSTTEGRKGVSCVQTQI